MSEKTFTVDSLNYIAVNKVDNYKKIIIRIYKSKTV